MGISEVQHTDRIIDVRAVIQQQTPAIPTVREIAEVPRRQQLDQVVDVAVLIQPSYSKRSPSVKLGGVQVQKGSSDIMKIVITETTGERPSADVDDGFATTESELAVYSGEAAERERASGSIRTVQGQLQSLLVKFSITGSRSTVPELKPNLRSRQLKAARTPPPQQQSRLQDSARCTSEPRDR